MQKQKGDYFLLQLLLEIELKADDAHCAQPKKGTLTQRRWSTPSSRIGRGRRSSSRTSSSCPARRSCCNVSIGQKENDMRGETNVRVLLRPDVRHPAARPPLCHRELHRLPLKRLWLCHQSNWFIIIAFIFVIKSLGQMSSLYISQKKMVWKEDSKRLYFQIQIPMISISSFTKEKTAKIIPNAIAVTTLEDTHTFTSFISREATYKVKNTSVALRLWRPTASR